MIKFWLIFLGMILIVIFLTGLFILILKRRRDVKYISEQFFRQLVVAIISGIFVLVMASIFNVLFWQLQESIKTEKEKQTEEQRIADIKMDAIITIGNEISENRLTLEVDIRSDTFVRMPLKTAAWENGKNKLPIKTSFLIDSLKMLYNCIEKYNWDMQFLHYKVTTERLIKEKFPKEAKEAWAKIDEGLLDKLKKLEKLTARELVILGYKEKKEYVERFGDWEERTVEIPFIKEKKLNKN